MEKLIVIVFTANALIFFITLLCLLAADKDSKKYLLFPCIISGVTTTLLLIFINTTPLALHVLEGHAVIEYKMQEGNVVDSCYVFKKQ